MAKEFLTLKRQTVVDIADAIRSKTNSDTAIRIEDLDDAIGEIESGGGSGGIIDVTELPTDNIDENAIYRIITTSEIDYIYNVTPNKTLSDQEIYEILDKINWVLDEVGNMYYYYYLYITETGKYMYIKKNIHGNQYEYSYSIEMSDRVNRPGSLYYGPSYNALTGVFGDYSGYWWDTNYNLEVNDPIITEFDKEAYTTTTDAGIYNDLISDVVFVKTNDPFETVLYVYENGEWKDFQNNGKYKIKNVLSVYDLIKYVDTSNVTSLDNMFSSYLQDAPMFDTSNVTSMNSTFNGLEYLYSVPLYDTSNVTNMSLTFGGCTNLQRIPAYDVRNVIDMYGIFEDCSRLYEVLMYGMQTSFDISDCTSLSSDSIVTICSNCQVMTDGAAATLSVGETLFNKLESVYVKETGVELYEGITCRPCVVCESTDEGAMTLVDYMTSKGWTLSIY